MARHLEPPMPITCATRDPETMTADERRAEVATILARGLARAIRQARARTAQSAEIPPVLAANGLDLPADLRLSVAPRPGG
jgi:hypothetical protein